MNATDITKEQFETLVLIRSLQEFITDGDENLSSLSDIIAGYEEDLSLKDHKQLIVDAYKLTKTGYIISDAEKEYLDDMNGLEAMDEDEAIQIVGIPEIEGITPKGQSALNNWEKETTKQITEGKKIVLFENFTLFNFDVSLLGGVEMSLFKEAGGLFKWIGKSIKDCLSQ